MIYQNQELTKTFFVSHDNKQLASWQDLANVELDKNIYFSATSAPQTFRSDCRKGSCFSGWQTPTPSLIYESTRGVVTNCSDIEQNLNLDEYENLVDQHIRNSIKQAYRENSTVNLAFSGSLDSMIVLSYILNMELGNRTRVVCFQNLITQQPDALRFDQLRIDSINQFFKNNQLGLHSTGWETITIDDLVSLINDGLSYDQILPSSLAAVLNRSQNQAWIGGWHGNRTMLHHRMIFDQMILQDPEIKTQLKNQTEQSWTTAYSHTIKKVDFDSEPVHVKYQSNKTKPWHGLQGHRGHNIYVPLGTESLFLDLRRINPTFFNFDLVAHGTFGRKLIEKNAPDLLNWMTKKQSENDVDVVEFIMVPTDCIDYSQLAIPKDLTHNQEGVDWLEYEINKSKQTKEIEFNTVLSIKNLQWISDLVHGRTEQNTSR